MKPYDAELMIKAADGTLAPFHISVGVPEAISRDEARCRVWCSILPREKYIFSTSPEHAQLLCFHVIRQLLDYRQLTLMDSHGTHVDLPALPD